MLRRTVLVGGGGSSFIITPTLLDTVTATKDAGNPTFDGDFIPENIVKVGSTYWCVGQSWTPAVEVFRLWSATDRDGPWTAYSGNPIFQISQVAWAPGSTDLYAPEITLDNGTFHLF